MTTSDMRGSTEEGYMSLPNSREDGSQIAWRAVPTPCLNQMSLSLPSWLITPSMASKSLHYTFSSGDLSRQAHWSVFYVPCILVIFLSQVIFQLPNCPGWLKGNALLFLALVICHLLNDVRRFPGDFTSEDCKWLFFFLIRCHVKCFLWGHISFPSILSGLLLTRKTGIGAG